MTQALERVYAEVRWMLRATGDESSFALLFGSMVTGLRLSKKIEQDVDLIVVSKAFTGIRLLCRSPLLLSKAVIQNKEKWDILCLTPKEFKTMKSKLSKMGKMLHLNSRTIRW